MEQAGYSVEDGMYLINADNLHILLRFVYKPEVLAGVRLHSSHAVIVDINYYIC